MIAIASSARNQIQGHDRIATEIVASRDSPIETDVKETINMTPNIMNQKVITYSLTPNSVMYGLKTRRRKVSAKIHELPATVILSQTTTIWTGLNTQEKTALVYKTHQ
jgi:hypothetical protein